MNNGLFKIAAIAFACAFYTALAGWRYRGALSAGLNRLASGLGTLPPFGRAVAIGTFVEDFKRLVTTSIATLTSSVKKFGYKLIRSRWSLSGTVMQIGGSE